MPVLEELSQRSLNHLSLFPYPSLSLFLPLPLTLSLSLSLPCLCLCLCPCSCYPVFVSVSILSRPQTLTSFLVYILCITSQAKLEFWDTV